jgi:hypothetical protein
VNPAPIFIDVASDDDDVSCFALATTSMGAFFAFAGVKMLLARV